MATKTTANAVNIATAAPRAATQFVYTDHVDARNGREAAMYVLGQMHALSDSVGLVHASVKTEHLAAVLVAITEAGYIVSVGTPEHLGARDGFSVVNAWTARG